MSYRRHNRGGITRNNIIFITVIFILVGLAAGMMYMEHVREKELEAYAKELNQQMKEEQERQEALEKENEPTPAPPRHLVTFIDDDGYTTFMEYLLPIIEEKGISISTAIEMDNVGKTESDYMTWEQITECHEAGAEILNHTKEHYTSIEQVENLSAEEILASYRESKQIMEDHGYGDTKDILIYSGATAGVTWPYAKQVFRVGINSSGNVVNTQPFNLFNMRRYVVGSTHSPDFAELKGYIDEVATVDEGWEIWMMHSHNGHMSEEYLQAFRDVIDYCKEVGVEIVSAKEALDYYGIPRVAD